jgi:hypothetical protein
MKTHLLLISLILPLSAGAAEKARICYFSLNDEKEFQAADSFLKKINAGAKTQIEVKEFLSQGGNPNKAFKAMVQSGVQCDGLVISGHHTGNWGGHRAKGKLVLDEMEKLSCDPQYADWFRNIAAVSLEGCRTLGVGEIEPDDQQANVDFHTNRVGQVVEEDGLEQDFAELNMEFSNTLDQDNPLASRYLRLFPEATLFGWTKSAPGEKSKSYLSMLYHMAQMSRMMTGQFPEQSPAAANLSAKSAAEYANAVLFTLKKFGNEERECQDLKVDAWLAHGNVGSGGKYYFDNPDLRAYPSLASSGDHTLVEAREIDCLIKNAVRGKDTDSLMRALDLIASNQDYLRFSLNTLIDLKNELAAAKAPLAKKVLERMRTMPGMIEMLDSKMRSKQVGALKKIDYYRFYQDLTGKFDKELDKQVTKDVVEVLSQPLPELDPRAHNPARSRNLAADYRATLFQSLVKNRIAAPNFYEDLLAQNPEADVLKSMALHAPRYNSDEATIWLLQISASPKADSKVGEAILSTMQKMKLPKSEYNAYYRQIAPLLSRTNKPMVKYNLPSGGTITLPEGGGLY